MTGLMKRSGKRTVCGMVSSRNRKPPCGKKLVWQRLCTMRRLLCLYSNRPLRELSGLDAVALIRMVVHGGGTMISLKRVLVPISAKLEAAYTIDQPVVRDKRSRVDCRVSPNRTA